jgi:hypothetical protein
MKRKIKSENNYGKTFQSVTFQSFALLATITLMTLSFISCAGGGISRQVVRIDIQNPDAIDFEQYDLIVYKDLTIGKMPKDYSPVEEVKTFFLNDLPRVIKKDIESWDNKKHSVDDLPPKTLVISGTLDLDIKERSKIKEVKGDTKKGKGTGKKRRAFVTVQHWNLKLTVTVTEYIKGSDKKELFNQKFEEKLANAEPGNDKFNLETLLFKITNRLARKVSSGKRVQRRYILF